MYLDVSLEAAKKIVSTGCSNVDGLRYLRNTASIDLGVCGVIRNQIRDSREYLYIDTFEGTAGIARSLAEWIDSDWSDPSSDYNCGDF